MSVCANAGLLPEILILTGTVVLGLEKKGSDPFNSLTGQVGQAGQGRIEKVEVRNQQAEMETRKEIYL